MDESNSVMVACGCLSVDILLTKVKNAQKAIAAACNATGKPIVVAKSMRLTWGYMLTRVFLIPRSVPS